MLGLIKNGDIQRSFLYLQQPSLFRFEVSAHRA